MFDDIEEPCLAAPLLRRHNRQTWCEVERRQGMCGGNPQRNPNGRMTIRQNHIPAYSVVQLVKQLRTAKMVPIGTILLHRWQICHAWKLRFRRVLP
ncbi:hypothetical protein [Mycobacterium kansasii]